MLHPKVSFGLFFIVLTLDLALVAAAEGQTKENSKKMKVECMKESPISEDDLNILKSRQIPTGKNVPCFLACIQKRIGIMDDHGMYQKEPSMDLIEKVCDNPVTIKKIEEYLQKCIHVNKEPVSDGEKGCERAILGLQCEYENGFQFEFELAVKQHTF